MEATKVLPAGWREIEVTVGLGDEKFPCLVRLSNGAQPMTDPQLGWVGDPIIRWNGFVAYPLFDRATVDRIREWCETDGVEQLEWDGDVVVLHRPDYADDLDYAPERVTPTETPLGPRWCVGSCSWTWSEVE